ncbi:hypothetical protein AAG906_015607 [Vitis piasezkii]
MLQWVEVMTQKCINKKHDWRKLPSQQMWSCGSSSGQDMHHFQLSRTGPHSKIIKMARLIGYLQGLSYMASSQYAMPPINAGGMTVQAPAAIGMWLCQSTARSGMAELYRSNFPQLEAESASAA